MDTGLPRYCDTILVPYILQPFVLIGLLGLCMWIEVGFCHSWSGFMYSSSMFPGRMFQDCNVIASGLHGDSWLC